MSIQQWSSEILLLDMRDEPQFSEVLQQVTEQLEERDYDVVMSLAGVTQMNSTTLGGLLRLRQRLVSASRHLRLCSVPDAVWSLLLVTSLDKVFELSTDVPTALASLQLDNPNTPKEDPS